MDGRVIRSFADVQDDKKRKTRKKATYKKLTKMEENPERKKQNEREQQCKAFCHALHQGKQKKDHSTYHIPFDVCGTELYCNIYNVGMSGSVLPGLLRSVSGYAGGLSKNNDRRIQFDQRMELTGNKSRFGES